MNRQSSVAPTGRIAILGAGNIGSAIADGLLRAQQVEPGDLLLTRRNVVRLAAFADRGCHVLQDNIAAVCQADTVILTVEPQQIDTLLDEISGSLDPGRHTLVSIVTGVTIAQMAGRMRRHIPLARAMPNTAIAIRQSMTCVAAASEDVAILDRVCQLFQAVGDTLIINEEDMTAATALGACGLAFFLRAIRAASQGGIEIGFHADKALRIAAQTARGAAELLLTNANHPEHEIDRVTTPRGVTIAGLNQMEHAGFSSAMIKGIVTSWSIASRLYAGDSRRAGRAVGISTEGTMEPPSSPRAPEHP